MNQSPIDLDCKYPNQSSGNLKLDITHISEEPGIVNEGLQIECKGSLTFGAGVNKTLKSMLKFEQFHFHAPSEHTLNGVRYPLEMHLVNTWEDQIVVIAFLFMEGIRNRFVQALLDEDLKLVDHELETMVNTQHKYLYYLGSLTTPPHTEGVHWLLSAIQPQLSRDQIVAFRDKFGWGNFRDLQDTNGRQVRMLVV